nr:DapH/DapD/GlmU-related protein [uncultured Erwinia sp.]
MNSVKLAETWIDPSVRMRECVTGRQCEVLANSQMEYSTLGDFSYVGEYCSVADASIGKFVAIANSVRIGAPNHPMERPSQHRITYCPEYYSASAVRDAGFFSRRRDDKVIIGHDVWIGHAAIVLPGVTIGDGAVIAAGAVVSKNVEPYTIVGGVPAKTIRPRFSPQTGHRLQQIAWWDWPLETIIERLADFQDADVEAFCDRWE